MSECELLIHYARTRHDRDSVRSARDARLCERHEVAATGGEPCWKAAREWTDNVGWNGEPTGSRSFRFNPPLVDWCESCQQRQALTEQLRMSVRAHASAKRSILQRGRSLSRRADKERAQ